MAHLACHLPARKVMVGRILVALERGLLRDNTIVGLWSETATAGGSRCTHPVSLIDAHPTLTDLAGLKPPRGLDHAEATFAEPATRIGPPRAHHACRGNHTVRSAHWSYIGITNRRQDPDKWMNLASPPGLPNVKTELGKALPAWATPGRECSRVSY